ncbi:MAG TPA: Rossmann-like and DUF2520 domain-containing protein [Burkholderiales bacterium]|nr:Rossmann-like and DUF2520 domain-containing protein [Burkholderiales bacterium]
MKTLNIIGPGRVGRSCGRMWAQAGVFEIQDLLARSRQSAGEAVKFIGTGHAAGQFGEMRAADVWMIATPDDTIEQSCRALAASGKLKPGNIVFHVSGATPSSTLAPAAACGALIASTHPIKTFTDAGLAVQTFPGTYCGAEGNPVALEALKPAFEAIGARVFDITPELKHIYHAGGVFSCNYLAALIEAALRAHEKAGLPRTASLKALEPIVRETVDAIFEKGPARALTGPISRGDAGTVARQLAMVEGWDRGLGMLYRGLGLIAVELARSDGRLNAARALALETILKESGSGRN